MTGHIDIVKFLTVEKYCDPMCKDFNHNTPLHLAAGKGHLEIAKFLILEECTPITELMNSLKNRWNITPFHSAAVTGQLDIVQFFISDQKCYPNFPGGQHGGTPLHYAVEFGQLHIVQYLTDKRGWNPSCLDKNNSTPLNLAAVRDAWTLWSFLI